MNTFAGFWRDGAVVKPEGRHADKNGYVMAKRKDGGQYCCADIIVDIWHLYYWLDTTTPTELTPQEAFDLLRVVFPNLKSIKKSADGCSVIIDSEVRSVVNWGSATEYPPRERWRVPTDADKGAKCRCWDRAGGFRDEGRFVAVFDDGFLTTSSRGFYVWDHCEVAE